MENKKYDAFISYRHSELDMYVAKTIEKKLESFKLPKALKEKANRAKIERVFRDQDELPIASNLSDQILSALKVSDFLIVICTPRLPQSEWCKSEIVNFSKLHGKQNILAVLAEGEPEDSFPIELIQEEIEEVNENGETVKKTINIEPLAADVRGKNKREINKKIDDAVLRLAAAIFGIAYDDLKQRHREREMRQNIIKLSIAASVFMLFAVVSTIFLINIAGKNQEIMLQNSLIAEKNEEIEKQKQEIEKQYKETQKNYIDTMARTTDELISVGRKKDSIYAALSVASDSVDDDFYSADIHRALNESINNNYVDYDYEIVGNVDMKTEVDKMESTPDGKYVLIHDLSNLLTIVNTDNVEVYDSIQLSTELFSVIDNDNIAYKNAEGKTVRYNISTKTESECDNNLLGEVVYNPSHTKYIVQNSSDLAVFNAGEYIPCIDYNYFTSPFGSKMIERMDFISDTEIIVITGIFDTQKKVYIYDIDSKEVVLENSITIIDKTAYLKQYFDGDEYCIAYRKVDYDVMSGSYTSYAQLFFFKDGKKVREHVMTNIPFDNITYDNQRNLVSYNEDRLVVIDKNTFEIISEKEFDDEDIVEMQVRAGSNKADVTYSNGREVGYNYGMVDTYNDTITPKFNKKIVKCKTENGLKFQSLENEKYVVILKQTSDSNNIDLKDAILSSKISRNGKYILVRLGVKEISLINASTHETIGEFENSVNTNFIGEGDKFYLENSENQIEIYSCDNLEMVGLIDYDCNNYNRYEYLGDGATVVIYDYRTEDNIHLKRIRSLENEEIISEINISDKGVIKDYAFSNDGKYFVTVNALEEITLYKTDDSDNGVKIEMDTPIIRDINISSDNKYIVVMQIDDSLDFIDINTLKKVKTLYNIEARYMEIKYIEEIDKYLIQQMSGKSYLLNSDLDIEDSCYFVRGYGNGEGFLISTVYSMRVSPYVKYEDLLKQAKDCLGDYEPKDEIKVKYGLSK